MSGKPNVATPYPVEEYNGDSLRAIAILFIVLTTVCVAIRFYARRVGNVKWGLDDSLIIPGTIFCLALCTCALGGSRTRSSNLQLELTCTPTTQSTYPTAPSATTNPSSYKPTPQN